MKLYIYEHCPFCSRVQYVARKLDIKLEEIVIGYGDSATPTALIGKKMVPILEKDNGDIMAESGDIMAYFMALSGRDDVRQPSQQAQEWQSTSFTTLTQIGYPRWSLLPLPEFNTAQDRQAWIDRKQTDDMNFAQLLAQTGEIVIEVNRFLELTEQQLTFSNGSTNVSLIDQSIYFSILRGYACESSITWPQPLLSWLEAMSDDTNIALLK